MMRVYVESPRINWSLSDVYDGLCYGLLANGCTLVDRREDADWIIVVNGNLHTPETLKEWRRIAPVAVLCTESPYDFDLEVERVAVADGAWTHERASLGPLRAVNPNVEYLPHAWHPERHGIADPDPSVPAHDVVFVGTGFPERIEWFNRIDWTGIDLGLYGLWEGFGLDEHLEARVFHEITTNTAKTPTTALYRRAKMSLNLYRRKGGKMDFKTPRHEVYAESLNPRAYELAAMGVFHLTTPRVEVGHVFGELVPRIGGTPQTAKEDERVIRYWLEHDDERNAVAAQLPAAVAAETWTQRARQALQDLKTWSQVTA